MEVLRFVIHYGLHFLFPGVLAYLFFKDRWKLVWVLLIATMLIDLDHLWASPIYDPQRCSLDVHLLHSNYALLIYLGLFAYKKTRVIGLGLLLHLVTDYIDCLFISSQV